MVEATAGTVTAEMEAARATADPGRGEVGPDAPEGAPGGSGETPRREKTAPGRVLVVDDDETVRDLLRDLLGEAGYEVRLAEDGAVALKELDTSPVDVVLLDLHLPRVSGLSVLAALPSVATDARFVVMTSFGSVESAVEAMKAGAWHYIRKPFDGEELLHLVRRAYEDVSLRREVTRLRRISGRTGRRGMVGRSAPMERVYRLVERVAPTRATVLITGETGTGKELVARAVHAESDRAQRPFVAVNCSALPETLLESELFGFLKGSFTGAIQSRRGLFEEAAGGTLFLDEISAMTPDLQVKLLRVLQEREVQRIGARSAVPVEFRLVAATNRHLEDLVDDGTFREDLYYRLNVFPIRLPALRERREDIPSLADHFVARFAKENGVDPPRLRPELLARLMAYPWPGNVRELESFIERSVIMYPEAGDIPFDLGRRRGASEGAALLGRAAEEAWDLERLEREYTLSVLEKTRWEHGKAADLLGISRRTISRKLARYREQGFLEPVDPSTGAPDAGGLR